MKICKLCLKELDSSVMVCDRCGSIDFNDNSENISTVIDGKTKKAKTVKKGKGIAKAGLVLSIIALSISLLVLLINATSLIVLPVVLVTIVLLPLLLIILVFTSLIALADCIAALASLVLSIIGVAKKHTFAITGIIFSILTVIISFFSGAISTVSHLIENADIYLAFLS